MLEFIQAVFSSVAGYGTTMWDAYLFSLGMIEPDGILSGLYIIFVTLVFVFLTIGIPIVFTVIAFSLAFFVAAVVTKIAVVAIALLLVVYMTASALWADRAEEMAKFGATENEISVYESEVDSAKEMILGAPSFFIGKAKQELKAHQEIENARKEAFAKELRRQGYSTHDIIEAYEEMISREKEQDRKRRDLQRKLEESAKTTDSVGVVINYKDVKTSGADKYVPSPEVLRALSVPLTSYSLSENK